MIHEMKLDKDVFDRIAAGQVRALIVDHDRDYQAGDTIRLLRVETRGTGERARDVRTTHFVDRDKRGRFVVNWVDDEPLEVWIAHVTPAARQDGLVTGHCLLSIQPA